MRKGNKRFWTVSADQVARQLTKGVGADRALKVAHNLASNLNDIGPSDVNENVFNEREVNRNKQFWAQVYHILNK